VLPVKGIFADNSLLFLLSQFKFIYWAMYNGLSQAYALNSTNRNWKNSQYFPRYQGNNIRRLASCRLEPPPNKSIKTP